MYKYNVYIYICIYNIQMRFDSIQMSGTQSTHSESKMMDGQGCEGGKMKALLHSSELSLRR